jgi:plastocyanin
MRVTLVAALVAVPAATYASAQAATPKLRGTVGPGFTIRLTQGGKKARSLRAGTYALVVSDRSPIHDFHISGPGLNKVVTGVSFVGTKTIRIKLKRGTYVYVCDPHRKLMHGRFTVR